MLKCLHPFLKLRHALRAPAADHRSVDRVVQDLLEAHQPLINQLYDAIGMDDQQFQVLVADVVARYAACVYTLPATRNDHHREAGGLFRHGLEVALFATRLCYDRFVGSTASGEARRALKRGWRYASLLTGLFRGVGEVSTFDVYSPSSRWNPYTQSLADWAKQQPAPFESRWNAADRERTTGLTCVCLFQRVVPVEALSYLHHIDSTLLETVIQVLGQQLPPEHHFFARLIDDAHQASVDNDREALRKKDGVSLLQQGHVGMDKYLVDAMRQLVHDKWSINQPGARLWVEADAVYLDWPAVCEDIRELLARDAIAVPRSPETMAEILLEHDYLVTAPSHAVGRERYYWEIKVPVNTGHGEFLQAVRLAQRSLLIKPGMPFPALTLPVGRAHTRRDFSPAVETPTAPALREPSGESAPADDTTDAPEHSTNATPERFFDKAGSIGAFLIKVARDINAGKRALRDTLFWSPLGLCVMYPETIEQFGLAPRATLSALRDAGWLESHPQNESRFVLSQKHPEHHADVQVFVLRRKVGQLFEQLMEQGV